MEQEREWAGRLAARIGQRVAYFRERAKDAKGSKLSAQGLADRCAELGHPLDRSVIAKLEKGHRQTVTVADVLVLAKALGVPPLLLLFPVGSTEDLVEVLPGRDMGAWTAAKWFSGEGPFATRFGDKWAVAHSAEKGFDDFAAWRDGGAPLAYRREQDDLFGQWNHARGQLDVASRTLAKATNQAAQESARRLVEAHEEVVRQIEATLRLLRQRMRAEGIDPDGLTPNLQHVDQEGGEK